MLVFPFLPGSILLDLFFSEVLMVVVAVERYLYHIKSHKYVYITCYGMINHRFKQMVVPFG